MKVKYNYIVIKNFRKHLDYQCDFNDNTNEFMGFNGVGKTTVLDAISWCLFGKNFNDEKKFNIYPIVDGEERKDLNPFVEMGIETDGIEYIVQREFYKSQGMKNSTTVLKINNVKFTNKEFDNYLRDKIGIEVEEFKLLSKTNYAISFNENELRNTVYDCFNIEDSYLLNHESNVGKFDHIKDTLIDMGIEKTKKYILSEKQALKANTNRNKVLVDELGRTLNEKKQLLNSDSLKRDTERKKELMEMLNSNNEEIALEQEKQKARNDCHNEIVQKQSEVKILNEKMKAKETEIKSVQEVINTLLDVDSIRKRALLNTTNEIKSLENNLKRKMRELKVLESQIKEDKKAYDENKQKEIKVDETQCPYCKQPLPQEMIDSAKELKQQQKYEELKKANAKINELIAEYNQKKEEYLSLKSQYDSLKQEYDFINSANDETIIDKYGADSKSKVQEYEDKKAKLNDEILDIKRKGNETIEMGKLLAEKFKKLPKPKEIKPKENITIELENINDRINDFKHYNDEIERYDKVKEEYYECEKKSMELETFENEYESYLKYKDNVISQNAKKFFPNIVFKTSMFTNEGKEKKCFIVTMNGKEYKDLSTGEKLQASICLVLGLQKMRDKNFPILIDNFESISSLSIEDTQIICCSAMKMPPKKVKRRNDEGEIVEIENPNFDTVMKAYSTLQLKKY